jgi:glycerol-3-phosphate acyltransferase PlsY
VVSSIEAPFTLLQKPMKMLFLDAIKGVIVILAAQMLGAPEGVLWTIAVLAVVGHCFSAFLLWWLVTCSFL